jgi:hypothetical protein
MSHNRSALTGMAVLGAVLLTATASAPAGARGESGPDGVSLRFGVQFHDDFVDVGAPGPSAGDETVVHDTLVDSRGRVVGHDGGVCSFTDVSVPEANCVITFSLPAGLVTVQFLNTPPAQKTGAITGGTGAYRDARGQMSLTENPDQTGVVVFVIDH